MGKESDTLRRALRILVDAHARREYVRPRQFARLLWPDSPCWKHHTRCGPKGSTPAGGMNLAAGGFLGKLDKRGLIQRGSQRRFRRDGGCDSAVPHYVTDEGRALLARLEAECLPSGTPSPSPGATTPAPAGPG